MEKVQSTESLHMSCWVGSASLMVSWFSFTWSSGTGQLQQAVWIPACTEILEVRDAEKESRCTSSEGSDILQNTWCSIFRVVSPLLAKKDCERTPVFISNVLDTGEESVIGCPSHSIFPHTGVGRFTKSVMPGLISPKMPATNKPVSKVRFSCQKGRYPRMPMRPFPVKKVLSSKLSFVLFVVSSICQGFKIMSWRIKASFFLL